MQGLIRNLCLGQTACGLVNRLIGSVSLFTEISDRKYLYYWKAGQISNHVKQEEKVCTRNAKNVEVMI